MSRKIGKVAASEKNPTTNDEFIFWLDDKVEIKPFDIIRASNDIADKKSTTYAIVKDIYHITDSAGPISSYVSSDFGKIDSPPMTQRLGVTYATAEVINNNREVYMPLRDNTIVEFAEEAEIKEALGLDKIKNPISAGFIEGTNNVSVPIHLNKEFLVGPEGAHLNISGISGLATKTSYAMFLLQAIQQKIDDVAIVILNVKGDDLLRIDEPSETIKEHQKELWHKTGLECKPFDDVKYFYPFRNIPEQCYSQTSLGVDALKEQADLQKALNFIYTYEHDRDKLDLLFSNIDDPQFTMESILNFICERPEFQELQWDSFKSKLKDYAQAGMNKDTNITVQSWRKFSRLINKTLNSKNNLFQNSMSSNKEKRQCFLSDEIKKIKRNEVFVIDIAKIDETLQYLIFGDVLKAINELKFGETDRPENEIPKRIVIFVDELNKYASSNSPKNSPILSNLLEITERGRSEGIILFSAEQFKSAIHDRVKGNCSTHVYGRTNAIEISKPDYKYIPQVFRNMMTRLQKGELIIQHSIFSTPLRISFPYPAYFQMSGEKKNE